MVFSRSRKFRAWISRRKSRITVVTLAGLAVVPILAAGLVRALSDTTPLTIDSFSLAQSDVNLDNGPVAVTLSGTVSDDLSGFGSLKMYYTSPSGHQVVEAQTDQATSTSFEATVMFPFHGEAGQWIPTATFSDASGNTQDYTAQQLANLGFSLIVTSESSNPDTTPPVLTDIQQWHQGLDVSLTTQNIEGEVTVSDENSGIASVTVKMISPTGMHFVTLYGEPIESAEGTYFFGDQFPMFSEAGRWTPQVTVTDMAGNTRVYDASDLTTMGFSNISVDITNNLVDTAPAVAESLGFSPLSNPEFTVEANPGGVVITAKGMFLDTLSGIRDIDLVYASQTSSQTTPPNTFVAGTADPDAEYDFLIETPPYPAEGVWLPTLKTTDQVGNVKVYSYEDLLALGVDMKITIGESVVSNAVAGGTVTTDTAGSGTSAETPVQIAVTTPVAGDVSVASVETAAAATEFSGYDIVGNQYTISAPAASAEAPLVFNFTIDASEVNGVNPNDIVVFRDGSPVATCFGSAVAVPDPCETAVSADESGNVTVTVNSSHASRWVIGAKQPVASFTFAGFKKLQVAPELNSEKAGSTVPVKFSLGGDYGLDVLAAGSPTSQKVNCNTLSLKGDESTTISANKKDLKLSDNNYYRYDWKTLKAWDDTCRVFKLTFTTGETAEAYFKF